MVDNGSDHLFFSIENGRIRASLKEADCAPDITWERVRGSEPRIFWRELTTSEARVLLANKILPTTFPEVPFTLSPEILDIRLPNVLYEPGVIAREVENNFQTVVAFRHPAKNIWQIVHNPKSLNADIGYIVDDNVLIIFDKEQLRLIKEIFEDFGKEDADWQVSLSFRRHQQLINTIKSKNIYLGTLQRLHQLLNECF